MQRRTKLSPPSLTCLIQANIHICGDKPGDIQVHNLDLYERVLREGSLGLGESYMDGWYDCDHLDEFIYRLFTAGLYQKTLGAWKSRTLASIPHCSTRSPTKRRLKSERNTTTSGTIFSRRCSAPTMTYSCAYWKDVNNLDQAQESKLDLICRKLLLKEGMRVLDIGCGWGAFAQYAARNYGVQIVGITISQEQAVYARTKCEGLPVEIRFQDYREMTEGLRPNRLSRSVRACWLQKLSALHGTCQPLLDEERPLSVAHHRRE